jgi:hypothetical protein
MSFLGLLRNPSGINPLTTGKLFGHRNFLWPPGKFSEHRKLWAKGGSVARGSSLATDGSSSLMFLN